jgi:ArsR family transcriptional regulator, arsenate/arsenite/antimonite-responsive transcriptional repressor
MPTAQLVPSDRATLPLLTDCCMPVVRQVIKPDEAVTLAAGFRALSDPARLRLISLVAAHADQEACVCDLTEPVGLSQPTISHHLKLLVEAGIMTREQRGKWAYYKLERTRRIDCLSGSLNRPNDSGYGWV